MTSTNHAAARPVRLWRAGIALLLVAALPLIPSSGANGAGPPDRAGPTDSTVNGQAPKYVTLITGDRVKVVQRPGQPERVTFEPAKGSGSTGAITTYSGGHVYVVPVAAQRAVTRGRLDRTLFDVTTLVRELRDDGRIPVIVRYAGTRATAIGRARQTAVPGLRGQRVLTSLGARAGTVTPATAPPFWTAVASAPAIQRVTLDRRVSATLDLSVPQIGAPAAWARGLTGRGVKVAVLDTGIDPAHPDVAGRITGSANFSEAPDAIDHSGHGTHVASTIAGSGAASGGKYRGVASEASLLNGKVLDDEGSGTSSSIIAGMEWAVAQGAAVVNLSLGSVFPSDGTDELSVALDRMTRDSGTLFVVAAGNCGAPESFSISAPAAAAEALAVGNLERDGSLNDSSCRGPRLGDGAGKPEISAPGTGIVAARAAGTGLGTPVDEHHTTLTGTSMATPHVAGTAALVAQANPGWKADQLRARLMSTADPQGALSDEEGAGRVDADQATATGVAVDTGELELGRLSWPYPAKDEISRVLTYRNPTGSPVTLRLAVSVEPSPAGLKVGTDQLVVPANGEAAVTVTADRTVAGAGDFAGRITAQAAGADPLVTTVAWSTEPERYSLTVKGIGRDGAPADLGYSVAPLDSGRLPPGSLPEMRDGTATARLAPGRYQVTAAYLSPATDTRPETFELLAGDELALAGDTTVTMDLRTTHPVRIVPRDDGRVAPADRTVSYLAKNAAGLITGGFILDWGVAGERSAAVAASRPLTTGSSEFMMGARLFVPEYRAAVLGGAALSVLPFWGGPTFTGVRDLPLADAGSATPDELAAVRGKVALIRRAGDDPRENGELVKLAEAAGATGAIIYTTERPGDNAVFGGWQGREPIEAGIPAMRVSRVTARLLLDRLQAGPVTLRITGTAHPSYLYDLTQSWPGRIPVLGTVRVAPEQLARLDETFGAHTTGVQVYTPRAGYTPIGNHFVGRSVAREAPYRLTSFVQANDTAWETAYAAGDGSRHHFSAREVRRTYQPGERVSLRWGAPVQNSGLPDAPGEEFMGVRWQDSGLMFQVAQYQNKYESGEDSFPAEGTSLTIRRNGEQVAAADWTRVFVAGLPAGPAAYQARLDTTRTSPFWKYAKRVRTTWSWSARGGESEVMPLVLADVDLPQASAASEVRTGVPVRIGLGLRHQHGSAGAPFTGATLQLSYDGKAWKRLALTKVADGEYVTSVLHPAGTAGGAPSLRLAATDAKGNRIEQEIQAAYGLK
ncbi:peptidase S8 and S53 subtilisin kexin sedolisin [Kribbella flavida DSM 17836]|uniref:Peptidase S8 and S53 subtilisin kexin sedolisin n=1 Tax=Kribbella flavida (strain DSM 17836 / JCM 10339 / NBRC 14399) TaxID=479435 RepID=D2PL63_KRIFD|nr:S8 family serine peptidase [Kribbella flavida]ADB34318.1 peptidase S8 and S53 subtilisin kexin sedolisin [Kribbella flavida DSM 17836]